MSRANDLPEITKLLCIRSKRMTWGVVGRILHVLLPKFSYAMSSCLLKLVVPGQLNGPNQAKWEEM